MPPRRVSEASPVQVYLGPEEQRRLTDLAEQLHATKSEVIRRGLLALEREVFDPQENPLLQMIGMIDGPPLDDVDYDVAVEHDRYLADTEEASWGLRTIEPPAAAPPVAPAPGKRQSGKRARGKRHAR